MDTDAPRDELLRDAQRLRLEGKRGKAATVAAGILARDPSCVPALRLLGTLAGELGERGRAIALLERAAVLEPTPDLLTTLGSLLRVAGRKDEALARHREALALAPSSFSVRSNLARALLDADRPDEALLYLRSAIEVEPEQPVLHANLGSALLSLGRDAEAEMALREALSRLETAEVCMNLGIALRRQGRVVEALASLRRAVCLAPSSPEAHWNLALALLQAGHLEEGFREYEWRLRLSPFSMQRITGPLWDGSSFPEKTLLLHAEQGFGDTIQLVRLVRCVKRMGGRVVLACPRRLVHLLSQVEGIDAVIGRGHDLPPFDLQAPLASLPHLCGIPALLAASSCPYLVPEPPSERVRALLDEAGRDDRRLSLGIAWQGNPAHGADAQRSLPLEALAPLATLPFVRIVSLQKGPGLEQLAACSFRDRVIDAGSRLDCGQDAFRDTASLVTRLDLVLSVDTAIAHLAGAVGAPLFLLLPHVPDWRWGLEGETSFWYPGARLVRQESPGDWRGVVARVAARLTNLAHLSDTGRASSPS